MRLPTIISFLLFLTSCTIFDSRSNSVLLTDQDYYEIKRQYSPDKTKILLTYGLNQGATGQGEVGTAILHLSDTLGDINPYTIAWHKYQECKWIDKDTVVVYLDYLKRMRLGAGTRMYFDTASINGIQIKYDLKDLIDSSYRVDTLFNEISPNNEYRAVAYRYINSQTTENFLNISIISPTGTLPKYGNYFISDIKNDYVYSGEWTKENELLLYATSSTEYIIPGYLVQNRRDIPFKIIADDNRFGTALRWIKQNVY